jgi:cysteine desulfurase
VPLIVGFGEAAKISGLVLRDEMCRIESLRDLLEEKLSAHISGLVINAKEAKRLPNTSSLNFPGIDADALLLNLPTVMLGTGSACTSGAIEPSHVLQAIGIKREDAHRTIRASLGRFTTQEQIYKSVDLIVDAYRNLK